MQATYKTPLDSHSTSPFCDSSLPGSPKPLLSTASLKRPLGVRRLFATDSQARKHFLKNAELELNRDWVIGNSPLLPAVLLALHLGGVVYAIGTIPQSQEYLINTLAILSWSIFVSGFSLRFLMSWFRARRALRNHWRASRYLSFED